MSPRPLRILLALIALLALALASAQRPLTALLPDTTLLAVEMASEGLDPAVFHDLLDGLDTAAAAGVVDKLKELFAEAAGDALAEPGAKSGMHSLMDDFARECPALQETLEAASEQDWSMVLGVSMSSFDPEPALLGVVRPGTRTLSARLLAGAVACFDGRRYAEEGSSAIYLFDDGSEMPVLLAEQGGDLVLATDPDLLRGAIRRANGSGEAALADARIATHAQRLEPTGLKVTLNLVALADTLELFRGMVPQEAAPLLERSVTTMRIVSGYAWGVTVDAAGIQIQSVSAWDENLATSAGEEDLLALLRCAGCEVGQPPVLPGAVAVSGRAFPLNASVAWLDSWLADATAAGAYDGEGMTLRQAISGWLGVDLNEALLDWHSGSWYRTTLGVYDTDLRNWIMGLPTLLVAPVTSEEAAWRGVNLWLETILSSDELADALFEELEVPGGIELDEAVSVRELSHAGVDYLRVRAGPELDMAVAVFDGNLVIGTPAATLLEAIDLRGTTTPAPAALAADLRALGVASGTLVGYSLTDTGSYLQGVAQIADLAAGTVATGLWLGGVGFVSFVLEQPQSGNAPTFDEMLTLTDVGVDALRLIADRTGVAVRTVTVEDGARWTTWRLPLGEGAGESGSAR